MYFYIVIFLSFLGGFFLYYFLRKRPDFRRQTGPISRANHQSDFHSPPKTSFRHIVLSPNVPLHHTSRLPPDQTMRRAVASPEDAANLASVIRRRQYLPSLQLEEALTSQSTSHFVNGTLS